MKNNIKVIIYIIILVFFASVVWIKYDYDHSESKTDVRDTDLFVEFINSNNIKAIKFSCPAKNDTIIYLDNEYLLTSSGELYKVRFDSLFENGHNCEKVDSSINFRGFYNNNTMLYDSNNNLYDINNDFQIIDNEKAKYYSSDLNNFNLVSREYSYIYFYDVEAKSLNLDNYEASNKLLIDNKGNINIYTNYGYPNALALLNSGDTEIIFDRLDYSGEVLSIYRSSNNNILAQDKVNYLNISMESSEKIYGIRLITDKGMYNEVLDDSCTEELCDTKLELDKEFSKQFDDIVYTNGKYVFIKDTPTTIYNIEKYVSSK